MSGLMADMILNGRPVKPPRWWSSAAAEELDGFGKWLRGGLAQAQVLRVDNVAEYLFAQCPKEEWFVQEDFPCLAPPFPVFWMEYRRPTRILSGAEELSAAGLPHITGVLACVDEPGDLFPALSDQEQKKMQERLAYEITALWEAHGAELTSRLRDDPASIREAMEMVKKSDMPGLKAAGYSESAVALLSRMALHEMGRKGGFSKDYDLSSLPKGSMPRWVMRMLAFFYYEHTGPCGPLLSYNIPLDDQGAIWKGWSEYGACSPKSNTNTPDPAFLEEAHASFFPFFMALTFLNCKNVVVADHEPRHQADQQNLRRHGRFLVKYKTLEIRPIVSAVGAASGDGAQAMVHPLHICRGHFKDYRERGLFGRHRGIYWWDNYARGNVCRGVVFKDYDVKPN